VLVHLEDGNPEYTMLTRDVNLAGVDMLIYGNTESARNAVHLIFSGELVRPNLAAPNPPAAGLITPEVE
jgi:hypothetical protein